MSKIFWLADWSFVVVGFSKSYDDPLPRFINQTIHLSSHSYPNKRAREREDDESYWQSALRRTTSKISAIARKPLGNMDPLLLTEQAQNLVRCFRRYRFLNQEPTRWWRSFFANHVNVINLNFDPTVDIYKVVIVGAQLLKWLRMYLFESYSDPFCQKCTQMVCPTVL